MVDNSWRQQQKLWGLSENLTSQTNTLQISNLAVIVPPQSNTSS